MAVENCMQLSTSATTVRAAIALKSYTNLPLKCNLPTFQGLRRPFPVLSSSVSISFVSSPRLSRKSSSIVCKASEAVDQGIALSVNDSTWKELVLESSVPVLVDFWAPWCGPCKLISPTIDELAKEFAGKIAVYKLNTDEAPNVPTQYSIRSIPTFLFFKNGERIDCIVGAVKKDILSEKIEKYIAT